VKLRPLLVTELSEACSHDFQLLSSLLLLKVCNYVPSYFRTAGYNWTDHKTNTQTAKELKIATVLHKLLEYKRNWIQNVNRMTHNRLPRVTLFPNWQKESWKTFEETSRYVRPERVNKWPNSMTDQHYRPMCREDDIKLVFT
jgi:hypothetical protein